MSSPPPPPPLKPRSSYRFWRRANRWAWAVAIAYAVFAAVAAVLIAEAIS